MQHRDAALELGLHFRIARGRETDRAERVMGRVVLRQRRQRHDTKEQNQREPGPHSIPPLLAF
jgi:hypothetical protein